MLICLDRVFGGRGIARLAWAGLFGSFGYALTLTQSRGGLLAAAAGFAAYFAGRYGAKRAALILLVLAPVGLAVFAGRQTRIDLDNTNDTSQHRVRIWSDGFELIPSHPLFGIGASRYAEQCGLWPTTHSSTPMWNSVCLVGVCSWRHSCSRPERCGWRGRASLPPKDADELAQFQPVIFGLLVSYMVGMFSLSRNYIPTTYLNLALATVYVRLAAPDGLDWLRIDRRMLVRLCGITVLGYVAMKLFIGAFVQF